MGDRAAFVDDSNDTRLSGELVYAGATVDDVLTVQADGSIAAAPGGGSTPSLADVLTEGRDAEGQNIDGVGLLNVGAVNGTDVALAGRDSAEATIVAGLEAASVKPVMRLYDADFNNVVFEVAHDGVATAGGVIFPSSDPHVAGAWWDDAGTLTKSTG